MSKKIISLVLCILLIISAASITASAAAVNTPQNAYSISLNKSKSFTFKYGYPAHDWHDSLVSETEVYYVFSPSSTGYYEFEATGYEKDKYVTGKTPSVALTVVDSTGKSVCSAYTSDYSLITKKAAKLYKGEKYFIDFCNFSITNLTSYNDYDWGYAEQTLSLTVRPHKHEYDVTKYKYSTYNHAFFDCRYCDYYYSGNFYKPKTLSLSKTSYVYDGKVKKPTVTVKDSNGKKISSSYYNVKYSSGRKSVGKYTVKVTFKKDYEGFSSLKKTFTIVPKGTSISSLTAKSKGFTAKWKKQTSQTSGYQLQYSKSSSFKSAKSVNISAKTTSKKVTKLTKNKKYYVRIRTYKTVSGSKYYSAWSSKKSVKTK
ncbi:MAG: fibronectin type III domain-containing protein [Clostridia bacterium]|nr:fibronectin type III domain-containing protein [Clostridia bacterium]